jgi:capsular polysaccharide biosynthesis protein
MELKEIIRFLLNNAKIIIGFGLFFAFLGAGLYFALPDRYLAEGSFYVHRQVEIGVEEHFTYEGYYGQQAALSYTNTVIGLFEDTSIKKRSLEDLNIPTDEKNLRKINRQVRVKKPAPQLVNLIVKGTTPSEAENLWTVLSDNALQTAQTLNAEGDPFLRITTVGGPVVRKAYENILINTALGLALGLMAGTAMAALIQYRKEEE